MHVPVKASDGEITNGPQREKPSQASGCQPSAIGDTSSCLVFGRTLHLLRVTAVLKQVQVFLFNHMLEIFIRTAQLLVV